MKSIIQDEKVCCITGFTKGLEEHHIFYGTANRKLSEKYGLKVWLRADYHKFRSYSVHNNPNTGLDLKLKKIGQKAFEKHYPNLDFVKIFGKGYLKNEENEKI